MLINAPTTVQEREIFMDILRGFAILGIFIANLGAGFSWYNENAHLTGPFLVPDWDPKMLFLHHWFIEGKFYSIFSILFGWGIALQIKRASNHQTNALPTIRTNRSANRTETFPSLCKCPIGGGVPQYY